MAAAGYEWIKDKGRYEAESDDHHLRLGYHKLRGGGYVHEDSLKFEEYRAQGKLLN